MPEDTARTGPCRKKGTEGIKSFQKGTEGIKSFVQNDLIPSVPFFHLPNHPRRKSISCRTFGEGCVLCG